MVELFVAICVLAYGGLVSRIHGGGILSKEQVGKSYVNLLWAAPFGLITLYLGIQLGYDVYAYALAGVSMLSVLKAMAHGAYFDLDTAAYAEEKLDVIVNLFFSQERSYGRDLFGLCVVGLVAVLGPAISFGILSPIAGLCIASGGLLKGPAYAIGWKYFNHHTFPTPTNVGEVLTGVFAYAGLLAALLVLGVF